MRSRRPPSSVALRTAIVAFGWCPTANSCQNQICQTVSGCNVVAAMIFGNQTISQSLWLLWSHTGINHFSCSQDIYLILTRIRLHFSSNDIIDYMNVCDVPAATTKPWWKARPQEWTRSRFANIGHGAAAVINAIRSAVIFAWAYGIDW